MLYSFADFNVELECAIDLTTFASEYQTTGTPDVVVKVTDADVQYEKSVSDPNVKCHDFNYMFVSFSRKLADWLPARNAFIMHSVLIDVEGTGIAFAAVSGTGKTTHMRLWKELLGDKMTVVNGDKPFVRFFSDQPDIPYGYGSPWCGKEHYSCNMRTPIKHICLIERSDVNSCEKIEKSDATDFIFNQVYMPEKPETQLCTLQLVDRLLKNCTVWKIKCNMDISAATTAYNAIFNNR